MNLVLSFYVGFLPAADTAPHLEDQDPSGFTRNLI